MSSNHPVRRALSTTLLAAIFPAALHAQSAAGASNEELDQRIRVLERQLEIQKEDADNKAKDGSTASAGEKGFTIKNADGSFQFAFRGLLQADGRFFLADHNPEGISGYRYNDSFLLRRVEPTFELTFNKYLFFRLQPQFSGDTASTSDVYGELRLFPEFAVRAGKFKEPVGLEQLQPTGSITFIERGLPSELAPNRDIGVQLQGDLFTSRLNYAVGVFNGAPDGRDAAATDVDNHKEIAARLFSEPFRAQPGLLQGLGFGVAGSYGRKETSDVSPTVATALGAVNSFLPRYRSPGQNPVFAYRSSSTPTLANTVQADGDQTRFAPQFYWYHDNVGLLGEYTQSREQVQLGGVDHIFTNQAWQALANYVITGEDAGYRGVARPAHPFLIGQPGWGAFEVALRYGRLDVDNDVFDGARTNIGTAFADPTKSISGETDYGVAFNWYFNANFKLAVNYDLTTFDGGAGTSAAAVAGPPAVPAHVTAVSDRPAERALFARFQIAF